MVKTPKTRHSRPRSEPVTIDLSADEVKRAEAKSGGVSKETKAADKSAESAAQANKSNKTDETKAASATPGVKPAASPAGPDPTGPTPSAFGRDAGRTPPPRSETASKPAGTTPKTEPRRGGGFAALFAGLIGGIVALAAAAALYFGGVLPPAPPPDAPAPDNSAIERMQTELSGLRDEIAAIKSAPPASNGGDAGAALEQATTRIDNMAVMVEDLRAKLSQLSDGAGTGADGAAVTGLQDRLASLEQQVAALPDGGDTDAVAADIAAMKQEIGSLRDATSTAADDVDDRIGAVEQAVAALATRMDEQAEKPGAGLAIAASALKAAIDRGQPFASELDIFASLAPDAPQIDALRGMAAKGVPTAAAIAAEADDAAIRMIDAAKPKNSNAGLLDRLWASAGSLVTVRPIGAVEGDSVPAIVARMEAAVKDGDYAGAMAEYETLPENAKTAGADFIAKVKARQTADELVGKVLADALRA